MCMSLQKVAEDREMWIHDLSILTKFAGFISPI